MKSNALKTDSRDNVVITTQPIGKGDPVVVNGEAVCHAVDDIALGHKVALAPVSSGDAVVRYGEPIVEATRDIGPGEWVHVHNTRPLPGDLRE